MADVYDFQSRRAEGSTPNEPPRTRNQEILAQHQADAEAADTPEARLLSATAAWRKHCWGITGSMSACGKRRISSCIKPPVRTAQQIVADADSMFPDGTRPLPPSLTPYTDAP